MKTVNNFLFLLAGIFFYCASAAASFQDIRQYSLEATDVVSVEVVAGKIINDAGAKFGGELYVYWNNEKYTDTAKKLRNQLIQRGMTPYQIIFKQEKGGFTNNSYRGIKVYLHNVIRRSSECKGRTLNYKDHVKNDYGCAERTTLENSLVNPFSYQL
ncbi:hypothetical protein QNH14_21930 [Apirhabdus apintestini]|uniref:hypothetical protein n=1 Tax=Erwinia sp. HR93 TaxID=3094840 RepID=UPI002ADEE144|nr:hypothetical protein [Erwinia sp. HR93]MEA1062992.1 hypothetical protein [Erwinia sp. HR93]WPM84888.1 hypothetical protein QNH14_21930 [Enterobacteriaceae bacterium CA-0114]